MQDRDYNDRHLSQLMQKSRLEMPFSDFEETVMLRIQKETVQEQIVSRDRKLSFIFFISGTCLGLILNFILQQVHSTFLNIPSDTILLVFQTGFVLLFLIQLDRNLPLLKQWKKHRQRI
jgi:hypothetical protein